ncbi:hypothetical protein [Paraclostridium sordellii]|uniref:hypothetical protein n=1 Tax=Paraclostridium sordellii TaxID=1505 RepID=UPI0005E05B8F|nr:hypothetical protein [Paeniclostridium sordellii]CEN82096.1 Uncharacterised protein [[Clostridium] sordellii] [Paeniclostridium sordellii]
MKNNIMDKVMQSYFKYLGIANIIFYCIYLINSKNSALGLRDVIFMIIASVSMVLIPVLYLVIMTKQEKLQNVYMYMNIIIVTMCFDILLLSIGRKFSLVYLIKSIVVSLFIFTPARMAISTLIGFVMNIPKKLMFKNASN